MTKEEFEKIYQRAAKFINLASAQNWRNHSVKLMLIVLGCDEKFWVVSGADGQRLEKAGYEIV